MDNYPLLRFDGGSRGNPGMSGCGFVIHKSMEDETLITEGSKYLGNNTNNYAEYYGLMIGLEKAIEQKLKKIHIEGDSLLVINQIYGNWKVKAENLKPLYAKVIELLKSFDNYTLKHIPRAQNKLADKLANYAMNHGI